jgi:hypothetical protein
MWESAFRELAELAARQHGLITAAQAARSGIGAAGFRHLVDQELLLELDWEVFQVVGSSVAPRYAYPLAAWLALHPDRYRWERPATPTEDAVVSHESACRIWGLGSIGSPSAVFTAPQPVQAPRGIDVKVATLEPGDAVVHQNVPVTTPGRTVLDLVTGWNDHDEVRRVLTEAVRRDLVDLAVVYRDLVPVAERHQVPVNGPEFTGHLLGELDLGALSLRNQHAYAALVS